MNLKFRRFPVSFICAHRPFETSEIQKWWCMLIKQPFHPNSPKLHERRHCELLHNRMAPGESWHCSIFFWLSRTYILQREVKFIWVNFWTMHELCELREFPNDQYKLKMKYSPENLTNNWINTCSGMCPFSNVICKALQGLWSFSPIVYFTFIGIWLLTCQFNYSNLWIGWYEPLVSGVNKWFSTVLQSQNSRISGLRHSIWDFTHPETFW